MTTKTACVLFGLAFVAVGILAFFPNPVIYDSENAIFHADTTHTIIHLASGLLFLLVAIPKTGITSSFMKVFGLIYFGLGLWGFLKFGLNEMGTLLGFLHVNGADNILHMGLGLAIFAASFLRPNPRSETPD